MFTLKNNDRLYLSSWRYNSLLILSELAKIVENHGGRVKPCRSVLVSNRSLTSAYRECSQKLERMIEADQNLEKNEKRTEAIAKLRSDLEQIRSIDNAPIIVPGQSWINFVLDGSVYYLELDDNFLFDFHYTKTPLRENNEYSLDACCENLNKDWLYDCYIKYTCSHSDRVEAANAIFNSLVSANNTRIIRNSKRIRVPNTYDGGYHMETVYDKERKGKLDY